jgi:hypothetical protein
VTLEPARSIGSDTRFRGDGATSVAWFGLLLLAIHACGCAAALTEPSRQVAGPVAERRAVERALRLMSATMTYPIVIIDPESVPDTTAVRQLDAFTVRETDGTLRSRIYINRESVVLQNAVEGVDLYCKVLAAVIVHEATHLAGGSEASAREAELQFFGGLVAKGLVSREDGLRYLDLLRQRPRQDDD